jgi:pSer/pThr/pTyr-binding forkhead associated (FHA) protein
MRAKLVCKIGNLTGKEFPITKEVTIGKASDNKLVIQDQFISRQHARIYYDSEQESYYLEDFKSRNGTKLDGERVHTKKRLSTLHAITFGNRVDFFFVLSGNESRNSGQNG